MNHHRLTSCLFLNGKKICEKANFSLIRSFKNMTLNFEKLFSGLLCSDNDFQMYGPRTLKLLSPYFAVLGTLTCICRLWVIYFIQWNNFSMKRGFTSDKVLKIFSPTLRPRSNSIVHLLSCFCFVLFCFFQKVFGISFKVIVLYFFIFSHIFSCILIFFQFSKKTWLSRIVISRDCVNKAINKSFFSIFNSQISISVYRKSLGFLHCEETCSLKNNVWSMKAPKSLTDLSEMTWLSSVTRVYYWSFML